MQNPFDVFIFLSSEDDHYRVSGGIGTYIGVLTTTLKECYPEATVYWLTRSPNNKDFSQVDSSGTIRHYLSCMPSNHSDFLDVYPDIQTNAAAQLVGLQHKMETKALEIIEQHSDQTILIESGEWEGQGNALFRCIKNPNIFKVARIHTPLATCIKQNQLPLNSANSVQMLCELETILSAHLISSCTQFMKERLTADLFQGKLPESPPTVVLPNPVNMQAFNGVQKTKAEAIDYLNTLFPGKFKKDDFLIFLIGSVEKRKGVQFAIDSVSDVVKQIPQAHFCFFGHHLGEKEGSLTANQKFHPDELYEKLSPSNRKHVSFLGYIPHKILPNILPAADLFPILSIGDNFPGTVAEIALSKGAILAAQRGGVKEMLTDANGGFSAYPLGDQLEHLTANLVQGIVALHRDISKRIEIGCCAEKTIREKYAPQKVVSNMIATYTDYYLANTACV
ncbi:MAG: hypothetical protein S4CHLAM2_13240 [Chlamydiales bacterium]|nr:hypothetical protein [Chlamydiales bacterium]